MTRGSLPHLTAVDWRTLAPERLAPLYAKETERWSATLGWETAGDWEELERGRQRGTISGVAAIDEAGTVVGWSYYVVQRRTLQIGSFIAASSAAALSMLDVILHEELRARVETITLFAFAEAPGLPAALRRRGLSVERYWYLGRALQRVPSERVPDVRAWKMDDVRATAALLGRAYKEHADTRPFASRGTADEWEAYVNQLTSSTGCGELMLEACICVPAGPNTLLAVALVTRVGKRTAHLAQLVVDPQLRGRRLGKQLLEAACAAAKLAGCGRITLFVGGRNSRARSLYESSRFERMASFLSAGTLQPRRGP